ncbi:MAG TPA: hypothetical protein ENI06_06165 [Spirochaetales bacterium]|nr:hypothetical protein [Spirochaetales bacterium]
MDELEVAVKCMRAGAFDYMVKAVEESRLASGVRRASTAVLSQLSQCYRQNTASRRAVLSQTQPQVLFR